MPIRFARLPTHALERAAHRLEQRIIEGSAKGSDIDVFVALASELGRRCALEAGTDRVLDGILDPRD